MPAPTAKSRRFWGAVKGAKEGQPGVTGAAKKVAKKVSKKVIGHFLKKENMSFNDTVNHYLTEVFVISEKKVKQRLDPKCWTGWHKEGTKIKGGVRVNKCVKNRK